MIPFTFLFFVIVYFSIYIYVIVDDDLYRHIDDLPRHIVVILRHYLFSILFKFLLWFIHCRLILLLLFHFCYIFVVVSFWAASFYYFSIQFLTVIFFIVFSKICTFTNTILEWKWQIHKDIIGINVSHDNISKYTEKLSL